MELVSDDHTVGRGSNEQARLSAMYEEQGQYFDEVRERQSQNEVYVLELRGRLAKLNERNATSEVRLRSAMTDR